MTDSNYTHYVHVSDRSGSMGAFADGLSGPTKAENATAGIRAYNADQAKETAGHQRGTVSLYQFDHQHETVYDFADIHDAALAFYTVTPRGNTALLDALGFAITQTGERLAALPEGQRPGHVIFIVSTDGYENWSHEYTKAQVKKMIEVQQETYGWQFIFIGAGIDAFSEAGGIGIAMGSTMGTAGTHYGTAYKMSSHASTRSRAGGQSVAFTEEERAAASGGDPDTE